MYFSNINLINIKGILGDYIFFLPEIYFSIIIIYFTFSLIVLEKWFLKIKLESFIQIKIFYYKLIIILLFLLFIYISIINLCIITDKIDTIILISNNQLESNFLILNIKILLVLCFIIIVLLSKNYLLRYGIYYVEYLLFSLHLLLSALLLISAYDFMVFYLCLEWLSLVSYILIAIRRYSSLSLEAAIKYFVISSIGTCILLYGISILYGIIGTTNFRYFYIVFILSELNDYFFGIFLSLICINIGIFVKLGVVPFHMWMPDVYEGSPTLTTAIFSIIPKITYIIIFVKLYYYFFRIFLEYWSTVFIFFGIICIIFGTFFAIYQTNLKRLFAYSAVTNIGYLLLSLGSENEILSINSFLFYFLIYMVNILMFFIIILQLNCMNNNLLINQIKNLRGLHLEIPFLAYSLFVNLLSMAGIPPFVGFWAKYYVVMNLINGDYLFIAVIILICAVVSAFYYIRLMLWIFFTKPSNVLFLSKINYFIYILIFLSILFNIYFFFFPNYILYYMNILNTILQLF